MEQPEVVPLTDVDEEKEGEKGRPALILNHQIVSLDSCLEFTIRVILMQLQYVKGRGTNFSLILNLFL